MKSLNENKKAQSNQYQESAEDFTKEFTRVKEFKVKKRKEKV